MPSPPAAESTITTVLRGVAKSSKPDTEIQAFALEDAPVQSHGKLEYTKVSDVLVLRELMDTAVGGMVVSPEGAKQIALMFTAACDVQTGKMPKAPIILFGSAYWRRLVDFNFLVEEGMIQPEDLSLFAFADTAEEAWLAMVRLGLHAPTPDGR